LARPTAINFAGSRADHRRSPVFGGGTMNATPLLDSLKEAQALGEDKRGVNPPTPGGISSEEEWSWIPRKNPDIVIHSQPAIAVYENPQGAIVLRQERDWCEEED
jgi:hypothetical protein